MLQRDIGREHPLQHMICIRICYVYHIWQGVFFLAVILYSPSTHGNRYGDRYVDVNLSLIFM